MNRTAVAVTVAACSLLMLAACRSESAPAPQPVAEVAPAPAPAVVTRDDHGAPVGLHNWHQWSPKVSAGAQPEGEEAFKNLAAMGVKTVISVDGAKPEADLAAKYGIRYVHVPIGYDGVHPEEAALIKKAVVTADTPVYIHCHHGKHRSAGAATVACIAVDGLTGEQAKALMKSSGTDPKYKGLWAGADTTRPEDPAAAARFPGELVAYRAPGDMAESMVNVDMCFDYIKASQKNSWGLLKDHPDVSPPHEAKMLWEHFRELARSTDPRVKEADFAKWLAEAEASANDLELAMSAGDKARADKEFERAGKACSTCHKKYRDN